MAPYPATTIANEFLRRSDTDRSPLTHMKLQKLVYLAHGWYLALTNGEPLIEERVRAWDYGPVIEELYAQFADRGGSVIREHFFELVDEGGSWVARTPTVPRDDEFSHKVIDRVWELFGGFTASHLSSLTHETGTPWDMARTRQVPVIRDEDIFEHFQQLATQAP